jgi:hypothetical protein
MVEHSFRKAGVEGSTPSIGFVNLNCPVCQKKIPWRIRFFKTAGTIGLRKSFSCPHCGKILIWSKLPYRLMWFGLFCGIIAVLIAYLTKSVFMEIASWVGIGLTSAAAFKCRFEAVHQNMG